MTTEPSWIVTSGLSRYYTRGQNEVRAVDRVDLHIKRGEFVAVAGASGSGKSTLLNLLAGLDTPTSGFITVGQQRLDQLSRRDLATYRARRVGMIFQSFNLLPHQTALKNVELALYFTPSGDKNRRRRAQAILERLGMADRMDHRPSDLSGGEQQRVAVARALVKEPDILFADEPTGNLDRDNSTTMIELLTELNNTGLTVIMVTHDVDTAGQVADRTIKMHYGRIKDPEPPGQDPTT